MSFKGKGVVIMIKKLFYFLGSDWNSRFWDKF